MQDCNGARALFVTLCLAALGACAREAEQAVPGPEEAEAAIASEIVGVATISDGDTIRIG